jgi:branched-chain amino acid aminotransferase
MTEIWCNGRWLAAAQNPSCPQDRGAIHGLGLFETMLAVGGKCVHVERHLARLEHSMERLGWALDLPDFQAITIELLRRNALTTGRARVRLSLTAGSGPLDDLALGSDHQLTLSAFPAREIPLSISLCLSPWPRNEHSPLAGLKCASYAENLIALDHARQRGFAETLFLNTAGALCEAATANVFLVKNGSILTPSLSSGCLPGIAREVLCELAHQHGLPYAEQPLSLTDLMAADEVFLSSATRGPISVSLYEDRILVPGPIVEALRSYWESEGI